MMGKVHVYMCSPIALIKSTAGIKHRLFPSPLLISTSCSLTLAKAFRNGYVAACINTCRSGTEKNEMSGHGIVLCLAKMTHYSSTTVWINFQRRYRISTDGKRTP